MEMILVFMIGFFYISRHYLIPYLGTAVVIILVFSLIYFFLKRFDLLKQTIRMKYFLISILIISYLIISLYNSRNSSWDGFYYTHRYITALSDKGYINSTEYPIKVYFGELIYSLIIKFFGNLGLNLFQGILFVFAAFLTYNFLKIINKNKIQLYISSLFVILSPTFLAFGFIEFKIDLIPYILTILSFTIIYERVKNFNNSYKFLLIPLFLGVSCIIKSSTISIALTTLIFDIYIIFIKEKRIVNKIKLIFLELSIFIIPITFWYVTYGGTIPQIENLVKFKNSQNLFSMSLERNEDILINCSEERFRNDYSNFIYGTNSYLVFFQPFYYIFDLNSVKSISSQPIANPGIFIYFGLLLSLLIPIYVKFKETDIYLIGLYLITFLSTIFYLIFAGSIFWYVLTLFPIYAHRIVNALSNFKKPIFFYVISIIVVLSQLLFVIDIFYSNRNKYNFVEAAKNDKLLKDITNGELILDASEHPSFVTYSFFKDWDYLIVRSNFYFASTNKNFDDISKELKSRRIKFIIVNKDQFTSDLYKGCPKLNNDILSQFIKSNTIKIKEFDNRNILYILK